MHYESINYWNPLNGGYTYVEHNLNIACSKLLFERATNYQVNK